MKKLLSFLLIAALATVASISVQAQTLKKNQEFFYSGVAKLVTPQIDTLTNSGTVIQDAFIGGYNAQLLIQPVITKISGTVAGVVRLLGSTDGITYVRILPTDSLVLSNQTTNSKIFELAPSKVAYYRIQLIGSNTQSAKLYTVGTRRNPD